MPHVLSLLRITTNLLDSVACAELQLPDSHGVTYPWDPPRFGISVEVLRRLRDELKDELREKAIANADLSMDDSRQPSPEADSDDEVMEGALAYAAQPYRDE